MKSSPSLNETIRCTILFLTVLGVSIVCVSFVSAQEATKPVNRANLSGEFVGLERAYADLRFHRPVFLTGAGDGSGRLFVVEQEGVVRVFSQNEENPSTKIFLDISERISRAGNEEGLIGFAFHPDYKNNGMFYVHYSSKRDQEPDKPAPNIVASFKVSENDPNVADLESETVVMKIPQPYANHNGGMIDFGADGYLYISLGDGGHANDPHGHGQNVETWLGSILRIDINDKTDELGYAIPDDNPFLNHEGARPELFAIGLRNVWRFSFDRKTGELWAADVGQNLWEEVSIIKAGGNYGWNKIEAKATFREETEAATEELEEPIAIYGHEWGGSITGGNVYRGKNFPQLDGSYFYGDYMTGNMWRITTKEDGTYENELVRRTGRSIASFGEDDDGEVFVLSFDGGIYRIVPTEKPEETFKDWPQQLVETGLFASIEKQELADHVVPYEVNAPFWSDAAKKTRFIALPEGESLGYRDDGSWQVPVGSTIIKNFAVPARRKMQTLETRLIKRTENGWEAATYLWDKKNQSATLQVNGFQTERWYAGGIQSWHAPSASECSACHVDAAGYVLGLNTAQLNYVSKEGNNQIEEWAKAGLVDLPDDFKLETAAKFCSPFDESSDLTERARVYMDVNCAMCHRPQGPGNANIDLRFDTPLGKTKTIDVKPAQGLLGVENGLLIAPGDAARSLMLHRVRTNSEGRMPNIGSNMVDRKGVELLTKWIQSLRDQ